MCTGTSCTAKYVPDKEKNENGWIHTLANVSGIYVMR